MPVADTETTKEAKILLSERDFARFIELLENPKPPTATPRKLMAEYEALKRANPDANL